jgi:hypothetical protein
MFRDQDILSYIWVIGHEGLLGRIRVEGMGKSVNGLEQVDGEALYGKCLGYDDVPSRLRLEVTEFGDGAEVLVLNGQNFGRNKSVLLVLQVRGLWGRLVVLAEEGGCRGVFRGTGFPQWVLVEFLSLFQRIQRMIQEVSRQFLLVTAEVRLGSGSLRAWDSDSLFGKQERDGISVETRHYSVSATAAAPPLSAAGVPTASHTAPMVSATTSLTQCTRPLPSLKQSSFAKFTISRTKIKFGERFARLDEISIPTGTASRALPLPSLAWRLNKKVESATFSLVGTQAQALSCHCRPLCDTSTCLLRSRYQPTPLTAYLFIHQCVESIGRRSTSVPVAPASFQRPLRGGA